jgi:plastocyanin
LKRTTAVLVTAAALSLPLHAQQPSRPGREIAIDNFAFTPARLVVQQGDVITWVNRDVVRHDVTMLDKSGGAGTIQSGASGSITATTPGTFDYICSRHPGMKGTIVVQSPRPAPPG